MEGERSQTRYIVFAAAVLLLTTRRSLVFLTSLVNKGLGRAAVGVQARAELCEEQLVLGKPLQHRHSLRKGTE